MHRQQLLDRLNLDDNHIFNQQIKSMCTNQTLAVEDLNGLLPDKSNTASIQFNAQSFLIHFLDKSWPQAFVHLKRCIKHLFSNALSRFRDGLVARFVPGFLSHLPVFLPFVP